MLMRSDSFRWVRKVFALLPPRRPPVKDMFNTLLQQSVPPPSLDHAAQEGYFKENPRSEQAGKRDVVRAFPAV